MLLCSVVLLVFVTQLLVAWYKRANYDIEDLNVTKEEFSDCVPIP